MVPRCIDTNTMKKKKNHNMMHFSSVGSPDPNTPPHHQLVCGNSFPVCMSWQKVLNKINYGKRSVAMIYKECFCIYIVLVSVIISPFALQVC